MDSLINARFQNWSKNSENIMTPYFCCLQTIESITLQCVRYVKLWVRCCWDTLIHRWNYPPKTYPAPNSWCDDYKMRLWLHQFDSHLIITLNYGYHFEVTPIDDPLEAESQTRLFNPSGFSTFCRARHKPRGQVSHTAWQAQTALPPAACGRQIESKRQLS